MSRPTLPLTSAASDRTITIWRMSETKAWEVDSCRGHFNNVSTALFHPKHELITFRPEKDRFWVFASHPNLNLFATGHDSGLIVFKLKHERPAFAVRQDSLYYIRDKYFGSACIPPRILSFNPAERAVLVTSSSDNGLYELTALPQQAQGELKDSRVDSKKGAGQNAIFVARNRFAVLQKATQIIEVRDLANSVIKTIKPPVQTNEIFHGGTASLILSSTSSVVLYDIQQQKTLAEALLGQNIIAYLQQKGFPENTQRVLAPAFCDLKAPHAPQPISFEHILNHFLGAGQLLNMFLGGGRRITDAATSRTSRHPSTRRFESIQPTSWETSEGMDPFSYGLNAVTNAGQYKNGTTIMQTLVDIVSKNGNFLLDIRPTAEGEIIEAVMEGLLDTGAWLDYSGSCIYDTNYWFPGSQDANPPPSAPVVRFLIIPTTFWVVTFALPANGQLPTSVPGQPQASPSNSASAFKPAPAAGGRPRVLVLLQTQKTLGAALKQNKALIAANAQAAASKPGRWTTQRVSSGPRGPDQRGYHTVIINLGKSFTILQFPWLDTTAFTKQVSFPDASPADIWKPSPISKLFPQQLTAMIYKHTPERLHELVDTADFPDFTYNFCHHASAERSSALKTIKDELPGILLSEKLITDITDPKAWRTLVVWPDDTKNKISPYPPILYHKNARNAAGIMKNAAMPLCARAILFGPASLQDKGSRRPQNQTLGQMWNVVEVNTALVSFVCTTVVFVCYWASLPDQKPESFTPVGATSKIDFREIYMRFRWALERKAEDNSTKSIFRFWHERVFKGITGVPAHPTSTRASEHIDEEAELEAAMGDLDMEDHSLVYSDEEDLGEAIVHDRGPAPAHAGRGGLAIAAAAVAVVSQAIPHPRAVGGPTPDSDGEVDESIESPVRPTTRRGPGHPVRLIVDSDDEAPSAQPVEDGRRAKDMCLQLEANLKSLKVADLRFILTTAHQPPAQKTKKDDLIATILASETAINVYRSNFPA
ncbi:coatomer WD associated region-domain-containing protein [Mycena olivaceomarginata]|nr:coatomer WD associated region-domain-containing protein [Mycena olivaceomarginata]